MNWLIPALSGGNYLYGAGIYDIAMTFSPAKMVLDAEVIGQVNRVLDGIPVNENTLAVDLIHKVGPQGSFLKEKHTMKNYRKEHKFTELFDRSTYDTWEANGSKTAFEKATEKAAYIIKNHKPDPLPDAVVKGIDDILEEACEEKGLKGWDKK